ncbi:MarR family winged helix-turn-helix transcriptional regulator [Paenibacillus eucommiae]|uniref:DNA-binding MarR family transcriptional regulator n=1 Tax=Paenibacillus eucommiae TaxID=1355755 RepID=A0ABS4IRT0_9BACL|nr:MarR family transcriptional regulator [Paenibacillus eucommiae]MBP1990276.1 DNA-binding MarR family transcriptional regulator [Paenibacillus eucommiae]
MDDIKDKQALAYKIKTVADATSAIFLQDYKNLLSDDYANLTSKQGLLLEEIKDSPKTVKEIAESFSTTPSAASQLISKMEKENYVKREINLKNRREIIVSLAEKGLQYHKKMSEADMALMEKYYLRLEKKDLEQLLVLQEKVYAISLAINEGEQKSELQKK